MPSRRKTDKSASEEIPNFEESLAKLEEIVESMEGEQLPLEDLVSQYEAGSKLLRHCDAVLSTARKRIELITLSNNDGMSNDNTPERNAPDNDSGSPDDENDISLF